jgi:hypothetical protein
VGADRRLLSIPVALALFLVLRLAPYDPSARAALMAVATLAASLALIYLLGRQLGAAIALLVAAVLNRYTFDVGGLTFKPEHLAAMVAALALLPDWRQLLRRLDLPSLLLLAWLLWSILGAINAPDRVDSGRLWVMLLLVAFPYFVVLTTADPEARLRTLLKAWLLTGIAVGVYGIAIHLAFAWDIDLGIQINPVTSDPTVPSTFREANLFGSAMMMLALAALGLVAFGARADWRVWSAAVVGLLGLQVSFTRTAWVAFVAGMLLLAGLKALSMLRRSAIPQSALTWRPLALALSVTVLGTALLWAPIGDTSIRESRADIERERADNLATATAEAAIASPTPRATMPMLLTPAATPGFEVPDVTPQNPDVVARVGSIGDLSDSSVRIRIEFAERALKDWRSHPIIGQGIGSFGQKYITSSADRAWLSNVFVRVLHDSGIVGLALFLSSLTLLAWRTLRLVWQRPTGEVQISAVALGIAIAGMLIAFQATEGLQIAWYWWSLGLFAAALRLSYGPHPLARDPIGAGSAALSRSHGRGGGGEGRPQ